MNQILCGALTCTLLAISAAAQTDDVTLPTEVKSLIPANTAILGAATADLNGDEPAGYILVVEATCGAEAEDPTRTVLIIEQKPERKFAVAARSDRAVITKPNGGLSDCFDRVTAGKNTFTLSHSGGRRDKW